MSELLNKIERYWDKRADSFDDGMFTEDAIQRWQQVLLQELPDDRPCRVLDIGTGPGFFAILLTRAGFDVTAVDYTPAMLTKARKNAGDLQEQIIFLRMDAQKLDFEDDSFDAIVTRNLTWNLERPDLAYREWCRILKKGGVLLNFDAGWYEYLFNEEKAAAWIQDRKNVKASGMCDHDSYSEARVMEEISRHLMLSHCQRPNIDLQMLMDTDFSSVSVNREIWKVTWSPEEQINYASTPGFLIRAQK